MLLLWWIIVDTCGFSVVFNLLSSDLSDDSVCLDEKIQNRSRKFRITNEATIIFIVYFSYTLTHKI